MKRVALSTVVCFAASAVACSSDRAYAPPGTVLTDSQVSIDVAKSVGASLANDLADQSDYLRASGVIPATSTGTATVTPLAASSTTSTVPSPPPVPQCTYSTTTGRWSCAPMTNARGLTVTRSYAFYDAAGQPMQTYDSAQTAKINYHTDVHGLVGDGDTFTGSTARTMDQTASGLLGHETSRTWDGYGVSADTTVHRTSTSARRYQGVRIDSTKAVTFAQPRRMGDVPLSGQTVQIVSYAVTSTGKTTETRSVWRRIVTSYNGTASANMQIGTMTCILHLDTHKVDNCTPR